jgi:hypothetical protein
VRCHKYSRSFGSIDRVDRWAVWRVLASLLPQTTLPQASPAAQLELDTRARRLSARAVWRQTLSWVPFGAAPPQVTRLAPPTIPSKPPRSSSPGTTMLGQSPLTRAHCGGGGARSLARSRALVVAVEVEAAGGYVARHARYARRASRACTRTSSPRIARVIAVFRPPRARPARARCCGGGARSLARARGGGGGGVAGGVQLHRAARASRAP